MEALLTGWGCRVLKAEDLAEALGSAARRRRTSCSPTIISTRATASGVVAALRQRLGATLPAVLITADRSPDVREALVASDVAMLAKPLKPAQLRALLMRLKAKREAAE